ncbi:MAG TPA: DUF3866 family protein [Solirubrobacterales bacterium]|nr:DUF3866 family protein [Solirubrobacterales bacterium]
MLKLRRGMVSQAEPLRVRVGGEERPAWADEGLVGEVREGDEVILNPEALDLGLGSGGFDVVHVNLTRGLDSEGGDAATAMKLNYTSLQHSVEPAEASRWEAEPRIIPVLVLALHSQLAPAAWAAHRAAPHLRIGYIQTWGGALPGRLSRAVAELRSAELIEAHVTAGPTFGGDLEALTTIGALWAAAGPLGWDAAIAGPGPGLAGSGSALGHGGMAALETAHAASALGLETLLAPRMSDGDPRDRHRGLSHHTATVLRMVLRDLQVAAPADGPLDELQEACGERHELLIRDAPLEEYAASGLPADHMGREIADDRLFFAMALAAGDGLAAVARRERVA